MSSLSRKENSAGLGGKRDGYLHVLCARCDACILSFQVPGEMMPST